MLFLSLSLALALALFLCLTLSLSVSLSLSTATTDHGHVLIVLEHNCPLVIEIEHGDALQLCGHTARLWYLPWIGTID